MADFPEIKVAEPTEGPNLTDVFDRDQVDNFIIGLVRAKDGFAQALTEAREAMGMLPPGSTDYQTQQALRDQAILREAHFDDQQLAGAGGYELAGEVAPLFMVPFGQSRAAAAGFGALASSGFFHDDPDNRSRLAEMAYGAGAGAVLRSIFRPKKPPVSEPGTDLVPVVGTRELVAGGPARKAAQSAVDDLGGPGAGGGAVAGVPRLAGPALRGELMPRSQALVPQRGVATTREPIEGTFRRSPEEIAPQRRLPAPEAKPTRAEAATAVAKLEKFSSAAQRQIDAIEKAAFKTRNPELLKRLADLAQSRVAARAISRAIKGETPLKKLSTTKPAKPKSPQGEQLGKKGYDLSKARESLQAMKGEVARRASGKPSPRYNPFAGMDDEMLATSIARIERQLGKRGSPADAAARQRAAEAKAAQEQMSPGGVNQSIALDALSRGTKGDIIDAIKLYNPAAKGLARMKKHELVKQLNKLAGLDEVRDALNAQMARKAKNFSEGKAPYEAYRKGNRAYIDGKATTKWDLIQAANAAIVKRTGNGNTVGHLHDPDVFTLDQAIDIHNSALRRLQEEAPAPAAGPKVKLAERPQVDEAARAQAQAELESMRASVAKGKQGGFAESDMLNTLAGAGVGAAIGGTVGEGDPMAIVAGALTGGALARVGGKRMDRVTTNRMREDMRKASQQGSDYTASLSRFVKAKDKTKEAISFAVTEAPRVLDQFMGSTMTRLERLAPGIAAQLKAAEFQQHFQAGQWIQQGDEIFAKLDKLGLTDAQQRMLKIRLLNSTASAKKYLAGIGKTDGVKQIEEFEALLNKVGGYLGEVDLGKGLRANYFPRMVIDTSKFESIPEVQTYLERLAKQKGIDLTDFEKEVALTQVINGALNRAPDQTYFAQAADQLKKRTVKVNEGNVDAYADLHQGFNDYIEQITQQVERRRFFKGQGVRVDDLGPNAENIDGVVGRLRDALKAGMDPEDVNEVAQLIRMRFGPGEQAPSRWVQNFKNLTYAGLLGNPLSAMTQFGDIALAAHRNGIANTAISVVEQIANRGRAVRGLDKETLLGVRNTATDFASRVATRDILNWSLKYSGFQAVDRFGKNTFIMSAMRKNQQMSKADFVDKWRGRFDPDVPADAVAKRTEELYEKVKRFDGITDANKEDIGFMLWNELEGVQPIALSALPERYLRHPDGRMAYMLQSFTLKLFDVMRKDIYNQAARGNYVQATKNAAKLSTLFVTMNGGVDAAKAFILGREDTVPDIVINNYLKMVGANKFVLSDAERNGLGQALLKQAAPPTVLLDAITSPRDALKLAPLGGKLIESRIPE